MVLQSRYRQLFAPLLYHINKLKEQHPDRQIAIVVPELVEYRWYHYLLHNQRATVLETLLLLQGDKQMIIINVPWYLSK